MNSLGFDKLEKDTKVVVAMSGGVDSSVAAVMLKKQGFDVICITLKLYNNSNVSRSKSCCAGIDIEDAKNVALKNDFKHVVLDYQGKFFDGVIRNFVDSYASLIVPSSLASLLVSSFPLFSKIVELLAFKVLQQHSAEFEEGKSTI